ncbi:MAG: hypothetical protein R3C59_26560 [Planctomycetaceae bacterium]
MSVQKSTSKGELPQPIGRLLGLLAGCLTVGFGGWTGMRPETVVWRALAIAVVTAVAVRVIVLVMTTFFLENDD